MGRKRIEARIKKEAVEAVKSGKLTQSEASRRLGVGRTSIQSWISKIESEGEAGLEKAEQNRVYSVQLKREAVESYLTGDYSLREICEMFKIRDKSQLQTWLKVYNSGGDFKRRTGGSRMKSTHKVTQEERIQVAKVYLSAILDLYDRRIVSYVISDRNDNAIVFDTFRAAVKANPDAHPLFHSDRGFQYTSQAFHHMLEESGMTQSMSRVAHCIDNGPMEGFWGILKREEYYGRRFTSKQELILVIQNYIVYYNTQRVQRNLGTMTPMEKHLLAFAA